MRMIFSVAEQPVQRASKRRDGGVRLRQVVEGCFAVIVVVGCGQKSADVAE